MMRWPGPAPRTNPDKCGAFVIGILDPPRIEKRMTPPRRPPDISNFVRAGTRCDFILQSRSRNPLKGVVAHTHPGEYDGLKRPQEYAIHFRFIQQDRWFRSNIDFSSRFASTLRLGLVREPKRQRGRRQPRCMVLGYASPLRIEFDCRQYRRAKRNGGAIQIVGHEPRLRVLWPVADPSGTN